MPCISPFILAFRRLGFLSVLFTRTNSRVLFNYLGVEGMTWIRRKAHCFLEDTPEPFGAADISVAVLLWHSRKPQWESRYFICRKIMVSLGRL